MASAKKFQPAAGQRVPTSERQDMICLSHDDFGRLHRNISEYWRPLVSRRERARDARLHDLRHSPAPC
jgi:hypothetical protein